MKHTNLVPLISVICFGILGTQVRLHEHYTIRLMGLNGLSRLTGKIRIVQNPDFSRYVTPTVLSVPLFSNPFVSIFRISQTNQLFYIIIYEYGLSLLCCHSEIFFTSSAYLPVKLFILGLPSTPNISH